MKRVLLVEDNTLTQEIVKSSLAHECDVTICATLAQARDAAAKGTFDMILLDLNLPDGDGFDFSIQVRTVESHRTTPIIFLTSRGETEDKVKGFSLGADDYIVKPFDVKKFQARVGARLKKAETSQSGDFKVGPFHVRLTLQKIELQDAGASRALELTTNQFKILIYFLRNQNRVVSRDELLKQIWGHDVNVSARTIDTHMSAIRRELADASKMIKAVPGQGFRFELRQSQSGKATA